MKPLVPLCRPDEKFEISSAGLAAWRRSDAFQQVFAAYRNYPAQSLQSDEARALLHYLIVTTSCRTWIRRGRRLCTKSSYWYIYLPNFLWLPIYKGISYSCSRETKWNAATVAQRRKGIG